MFKLNSQKWISFSAAIVWFSLKKNYLSHIKNVTWRNKSQCCRHICMCLQQIFVKCTFIVHFYFASKWYDVEVKYDTMLWNSCLLYKYLWVLLFMSCINVSAQNSFESDRDKLREYSSIQFTLLGENLFGPARIKQMQNGQIEIRTM